MLKQYLKELGLTEEAIDQAMQYHQAEVDKRDAAFIRAYNPYLSDAEKAGILEAVEEQLNPFLQRDRYSAQGFYAGFYDGLVDALEGLETFDHPYSNYKDKKGKVFGYCDGYDLGFEVIDYSDGYIDKMVVRMRHLGQGFENLPDLNIALNQYRND